MKVFTEQITRSGNMCVREVQITLDKDFNVADSKADIERIIREWGNVYIESVKMQDLKAQVKGTLDFAVCYAGRGVANGMPVKMTGGIAFDEDINLPESPDREDMRQTFAGSEVSGMGGAHQTFAGSEVSGMGGVRQTFAGSEVSGMGGVHQTFAGSEVSGKRGEDISCTARLDDLSIRAVNSRKINVRAIVTLSVVIDSEISIEAAVDCDGEEDMRLQVKRSNIRYTQQAVKLKDNLRIRQTMQLPASQPNIGEIKWEEMSLRGINGRYTDEGLVISGEIAVLVIYEADVEKPGVQWFEGSAAFEEMIDVSGSSSDMVSFVKVGVLACNVEARPNYDGEMRDISLELVAQVDAAGYVDREQQLIEDAYLPCGAVNVTTQELSLKHLVMRNNSSCRVSEPISVEDSSLIQIVGCMAKAQLDGIKSGDDGIVAEGALLVDVMYIASDDETPLRSVSQALPFVQKLTMVGDAADAERECVVSVDSVNAVMSGNGEIQINARVTIDVICFTDIVVRAVTDIEVIEADREEMVKLPFIVGITANGRDNLWTIAKNNHSTVDILKRENDNLPEHCDETYVVPFREKVMCVLP